MILKKGLSVLISLCMILTITPITAYADEPVVAQIQESASQEKIAQEDEATQTQDETPQDETPQTQAPSSQESAVQQTAESGTGNDIVPDTLPAETDDKEMDEEIPPETSSDAPEEILDDSPKEMPTQTPEILDDLVLLTLGASLPDEYTITYNNLYGGTVSPANPTKYTAETETFTLNNPTRKGYTFDGWTGTDLSEMTKTVTIPQGSTGNRTYTANWSSGTYTLTLNKGQGILSVTGAGQYNFLKQVIVTAEVCENYRFKAWKKPDGPIRSICLAYSFDMPAEDVELIATAIPVITVTADSSSKPYDGTPLTSPTYTYTGDLAPGDELDVTVQGSITDVGSVANTITSCKITRAGVDIPDEYVIVKVPGTLTVTKPAPTPPPTPAPTPDPTPTTPEKAYNRSSKSHIPGYLSTSNMEVPLEGAVTGDWTLLEDGTWTFAQDGVKATGFKDIVLPWGKAGRFYFDDGGNMLTGWHFIDDKWYYFNQVSKDWQGAMLMNARTPDGYNVDSEGAWIQ